MSRSYTTPFAVVIGNDVSVWGSDVETRGRATHGLMSDLTTLLNGVSRMCEQDSVKEVPVIIDTDTPVAEFAQQAPNLRDAGWHFTDMRAWTRMSRGSTVVYLGIRSGFTPSRVPLYDGLDGARELHAAAVGFHRAVGMPFWGAPGMVGCELIRRHHPGVGPKVPRWQSPLPLNVKPAGPLHWRTDTPPTRPVVVLDLNAAYCAAAQVSEVAADALIHSTESQFYPGRAGYWHLQLDPARVAELHAESTGPTALDWSRVGQDGRVWVTAPIARYVLAYHAARLNATIVESWTAPGVRGVLRPWAEQVRAAYVGVNGEGSPVERAVKRVYKDTTGMLAREGGRTHRPDWAHHIIDMSRVNLVRRLDGAWDAFRALALTLAGVPRLVAVKVDEVQYEVPDGYGPMHIHDVLNRAYLDRYGQFAVTRQPGYMKYVETIEPDEWAARHANKRGAR